MSWIIEKYRKEAEDTYNGQVKRYLTWRGAILEAIFRPEFKVGSGKAPMTHLHPDSDKLHLPPHCYLPDWRKYRVEDHAILVNFQKRCHAAGLHDPWLRNFAFNFYPNRICSRSATRLVTEGLGFGFVAAGTIFIGHKIYKHFFPYDKIHTPEYIEKYGNRELH